MHLSQAQQFIHVRTYARWLEDEGRRETSWDETCDRYFRFMRNYHGSKVPDEIWALCEKQVRSMGAMPSMRAAWAAGPALEKNHVTGYNCAYTPIDDLRSFAEVLYVLMCGAGVGFSVERQYVEKLPEVRRQSVGQMSCHTVPDSKEGWADALLLGLQTWFDGRDISFDYSQIRPKGARLKTMGGRASGPGPLKKLLTFVRQTVLGAQGRKLTSLECHDICNEIAEIVVVGGVRRSSEISFSDLDDDKMRDAKKWPFPDRRFMANNSAVYFDRPDVVTFFREWQALKDSGSGERGIFNYGAAVLKAPERRRLDYPGFRTNPCGEILLRPRQFCNLTEVVVRADDTLETLTEKVKAATWLGVMQAALTDFPYLRPEWKKNCQEEALLGVSLTGQLDNPAILTDENLQCLSATARYIAEVASKAIGINMPAAITTGKPSGTVSQLVDSASGAHPRHAPYYIRRYRISATDPLFRMMRDQGMKFTPENGQDEEAVNRKRIAMLEDGYTQDQIDILCPPWTEEGVQTWVCAFPMKAPEGAVLRDQMTAIQQVDWYLRLMRNYCEHNQSITIYVRDHEWMELGAYVYQHFDEIVGVSFLPFDGGKYEQAPYEEIDQETYETMVRNLPTFDWTALSRYELEDGTTGAQTLACVSGVCEI